MRRFLSDTELPVEWQQARLSRDARFDGVFYIGVLTTGIFCRPVCPARLPREDNVRYLRTPAEAIAQGFRPCRRCRPEYSPRVRPCWPDERMDSVLNAIDNGYLDRHDLPELARTVALSDRQLRRLFLDNLGTTPSRVAETRRLMLAKQLLCESNLSMTQVAEASGFNSIRRFNSKVKSFYQQTPSEIRQAQLRRPTRQQDEWVIDIPHSDHYPWQQVFHFYQQRAVEGLEHASENCLQRIVHINHQPVLLRCEKLAHRPALRLTLTGADCSCLSQIIALTRKALDLNSNHLAIAEHLARSKQLAPLTRSQNLIALPGAWDPFEYLIRAILGQQVSVKAARTLTARLLERCGEKLTLAGQTWYRFPTAETLATADLRNFGMPQRRIDTLQQVARVQANGDIDMTMPHNALNPTDAIVSLRQSLLNIKGIGIWTVDYLLMRAFYQPDIWLDTDLGIINAVKKIHPDLDKKSLKTIADDCSPWRSYAVMTLWHSLSAGT